MIINEGKCEVVHFSRKTPIIQSYILNGTTLKQSNLTKDLGVYLDNRLSFNFHAAETIKSANRMLSFVIRSCKNFKKVTTFKILYYALVCCDFCKFNVTAKIYGAVLMFSKKAWAWRDYYASWRLVLDSEFGCNIIEIKFIKNN